MRKNNDSRSNNPQEKAVLAPDNVTPLMAHRNTPEERNAGDDAALVALFERLGYLRKKYYD